MKKQQYLRVTLEYRGQVLYDKVLSSLDEVITIGRSSSCLWRIPGEDSAASSHHAALSARNGEFRIRDTGSVNGILFNGERIEEKKLAPNDRFQLGSSLLTVQSVDPQKRKKYFLLYESVVKKGKAVPLEKELIVFGSEVGEISPCGMGSTYVVSLPEEGVSKRHFEIKREADGCWIRDTGSSNGTFVNGEKLQTGGRRLLKDLDVISAGLVDLSFHDQPYSPVHIWKYLLTIGITGAVAAVIAVGMKRMETTAATLVSQAQELCKTAKFDEARELLDKAKGRNDYYMYQETVQSLYFSMNLWQQAWKDYELFKEEIVQDVSAEVVNILMRTEKLGAQAYGWNADDAPKIRQELTEAKRLVDAYLSGRTLLDSIDQDGVLAFKAKERALEEALDAFKKGERAEYYSELISQSSRVLGRLKKNISIYTELDGLLKMLEERKVDYPKLIPQMENLRDTSDGAVSLRIRKCLLAIGKLHGVNGHLTQALKDIFERFDFSALERLDARTELPSLEECSVSEYLGRLSQQLGYRIVTSRQKMRMLQTYLKELNVKGFGDGDTTPDVFQALGDKVVQGKVLGCDALLYKKPRLGRDKPVGDYDRVLGIEPFYSYLWSLTEPIDMPSYLEDTVGFKPSIFQLRELAGVMENYRRFFMEKGHEEAFSYGKVRKYYQKAVSLLEERDRLVKYFLKYPAKQARERIIAFGIANFMAPAGMISDEQREAMEREFKKLNRELAKLGGTFDPNDPENAIRVRNEILNRGIPASSGIVKKMWENKWANQ